MLAAIDATSWANRRGYGRFARNAVSALLELDAGARYVLVCDEATAAREDLPPRAAIHSVRSARPAVEAAAAESRRPLGDLLRLARAVARLQPDVVLFPSVYTWFPTVRVPTVVGVHDLIAEEHPELTLPSRGDRARWRVKRAAAIRGATRIFTVSETSRGALSAALRVAPESLTVVPEAPEAIFGPREPEALRAALAPLGLAPGAYLLYVGGISPHKGLDTLVDAYALLAGRGNAPPLVLTGALEDEAYLSAAESVRGQIAAARLGDRVQLPGHVADDELAALYAGALAFVSPSRSEGFGLPAVEAAASGTAVVLSDIPAHRESLGDGALFFPVGDATALAAALERLVAEPDLRDARAAAARERVSGLSWARAAEVLRELLEEAAGG